MKIIKFPLALAVTLMIASSAAIAEELYCEPVESKGEGHWPIPERAFTKANVIKKLERLESFLDEPAYLIEGLENIKHNTFMIFEGYVLRKRIADLEPRNSEQAAIAKKEFCNFLKIKAYVSH